RRVVPARPQPLTGPLVYRLASRGQLGSCFKEPHATYTKNPYFVNDRGDPASRTRWSRYGRNSRARTENPPARQLGAGIRMPDQDLRGRDFEGGLRGLGMA